MLIFFCPTKYSLINCLHIKYTYHPYDKAILFLYDQNNVFPDIVKRLRTESVFEKIIFTPITHGSSAITRWINTISDLLLFDRKYKKLLSRTACSIIYTHGNNFALDVIHKNVIKTNPDLQWVIYEEGVGSYVNNPDTKYSRKSLAALRLFSLVKPKGNRKIMLYMPEIDTVIRDYKVVPLTRINPYNQNFITFINKIFNYSAIDYTYNYIYLSLPFRDYLLPENVYRSFKMLEKDLLLLIQAQGNGRVAVKPHPNDYDKIEVCDFINDYNPFELSLLNQDIANKVLVTITSTAAITPKVIFNKEPIVIILIKLFRDYIPEKDFVSLISLFEKIKLHYSSSSRFFIPETKSELIQYIGKF